MLLSDALLPNVCCCRRVSCVLHDLPSRRYRETQAGDSCSPAIGSSAWRCCALDGNPIYEGLAAVNRSAAPGSITFSEQHSDGR